jgi:hypothetical protein
MNIIEILKEGVRVVILAVISYLLTGVVLNNLLTVVLGSHLDPAIILYISGLLTAVLRGIEKELHTANSKLQLPF